MPFRMNDRRARLNFLTSAAMPSLLQRGAHARGLGSATQYVNRVLVEAVAADLGIPLADLMADLPPGRVAQHPKFKAAEREQVGPGNTDETVR